ncbi:MAG: NTP transferase domain-containing protein [Candidatus Omnitrophica bacterium]|nr:NTP transferase domain-containing protein [Candidatus Omnitrophota bacterium]
MKSLRTIILAAGKGTRFKSETPKVLHELWGRPVIDYVIDVAEAVGSLRIDVVVGHKAEAVAEAVQGRASVVVQKEQLGTAHAVRCCSDKFRAYKGDVLVMCGDTPLLDKKIVRSLVMRHRKSGAACTFLTARISNSHGYGRIIRGAGGQVVAIREEKDANADEKKLDEINVGVYCFASELLFRSVGDIRQNARKREFYLTDIIELLLSLGKKVDTVTTDDWTANLGINTRADLALAGAVSREKILKYLMADGVTVVDPATTYVEPGVRIGSDTIIFPCTYIHQGVRIGKNCSVGPFARLRPGTSLADGATVGNFIEVSRSSLGPGAVAKHFSFLGDAVVGAQANIGCGTVTANYDGKNKNKTNIGRKAFIGCDTVLVAPVKIGNGAVTGAGSVVTKGRDVPDGMLAVGLPARVIKKVNK